MCFTGSLSLSAQNTNNYSLAPEPDQIQEEVVTIKPAKQQPDYRNKAATIWSEDFAGGFPSTWTIDDQSGICPWVYSTDGSWGNFSGGGTTAGAAAINSTTSSNGFLINDPDSANHFTYGQPSGANYQYLTTSFKTDAIDCSGHPNVKLEFEQSFRFNNNLDLEVSISNDNLSWTTYLVQGTAVNNTASADPDLVSINISPVAGNQPTVYVRIGWSARVYYWMIDDMRIIDAPTNDIDLTGATYSASNQVDYAGERISYTKIPENHLIPIRFDGTLNNGGANDANNAALTVDIQNAGGTTVYSASGAGQTISSATSASDSIFSFTNNTIDDYTILYNVTYDSLSADIDPTNNVDTANFSVTESVYARDDYFFTGSGYNRNGDPYELCNLYQLTTSDTLTGVSVVLDDNTDPGELMYIAVYDFNLTDGTRTFIDASNDYTILASDLPTPGTDNPTPVLIPFNTPLTNNGCLVCVGNYGGGIVAIARGGISPPLTSYLLDGTDNTWYYTSTTGMIRMHTGALVQVASISVNGPATLDVTDAPAVMTASILPTTAANQSVSWSVDNTSLASIDASGMLTPLSDGVVTVTATANDGSGVTGSAQVTITNTTGVSLVETEKNPFNLQFYPNPNAGITTLSFELSESANSDLIIFDLAGQMVTKIEFGVKNVQKHQMALNLQALPSGIYTAELRSGFNVSRQQIIITK